MVGLYQVLECLLELRRWMLEFNEGFTESWEGLCDADRVIGDHGTQTFESLHLFFACLDVPESKTPRSDDFRKAKSQRLRI
jgi:hypothetical protein